MTAAAAGELDTDEGVARTLTRLLEDKQLDKPRIMRFFREYFGYAEAEDVFKEEVKGVPRRSSLLSIVSMLSSMTLIA